MSDLAALVRRSASFHDLSDELLGNVLDLLAGRYPSEEFSELRPRIVWDRVNDTVRARDGSKRLAVTSGGTIPDRGLFGVFLPDGTRVGELDEEMVYESRPGDAFMLGASTWRIEDISFERVTVTPAPGVPAKMPFWHGDRPGRPLELGRALGAFVREIRSLPRGRGDAPARGALRARSPRGVERRAVPRRAGGVHGRRARRPHDRRRALPRRDRRLAGVPAQPVRHARARTVGDGDRAPLHGPARPAGGDDVGRRRDRGPAARGRRRARRRVVRDLARRDRRARRVEPAADVAVRLPVPRVRRPGAAAAAPAARSAHAALAAAPARGRPAGGGVQVPDLPDPARDVAGVPPGRVRRPRPPRGADADQLAPHPARARRHGGVEPDGVEPAVQLDRRLHVRGRRAARRTPGGGAGARPRPAARAARRGGAARAARPRCARRCRARAAVPHRRAPGPYRRRAARRAAPGRRPDRCRGRPAFRGRRRRHARPARRRNGGRSRSRSPASRGSPPPRTPPATATRSVARSRSGSRWRSPSRCRARSRSSSPASPAPTGRSSPTTWRGDSASRSSGSRARSRRSPPTSGWCAASSDPTACSANGATPTCCASCGGDRWRRCGARSSRSNPKRWRGSCRRGTASAATVAAPRRWSRRSACWRARRSWRRRSNAICSRRGSPAIAPPTLDELCTSGEVVWVGAGAIGQRDGRIRLCFADQVALLAPGWETPEPPDGEVHDAIRAAARRHRCQLLGARCALPAAGAVRRRGAGRAVGSRVGGRGHQRLAGAAAGGARRRRDDGVSSVARPRTGRAPRPGRLARLGPPASAGRWSLVAPLLLPGALADRGRPRPGAATARAPRRRHPRGRARRRSRRRIRLGLRRVEGARRARPCAARLLRVRARRGPVRVAGRGRPAALRTRARARRSGARARRHRSGPAVRRHAAVAGGRAGRARPCGAHGVSGRRLGGRACRWSGSSAARTISSRSRLPPPTRGGRRRSPTSCGAAPSAASRCARSTASR